MELNDSVSKLSIILLLQGCLKCSLKTKCLLLKSFNQVFLHTLYYSNHECILLFIKISMLLYIKYCPTKYYLYNEQFSYSIQYTYILI